METKNEYFIILNIKGIDYHFVFSKHPREILEKYFKLPDKNCNNCKDSIKLEASDEEVENFFENIDDDVFLLEFDYNIKII